MKQAALILLVMIVVIAGCREKAPAPNSSPSASPGAASPTPAEESHRVIERYNHLLAEGYKAMNMTNLQEVATKELAEKAYYHMAAISEGKSRLVSRLKRIDFVETDCSKPMTCTVMTREMWDFGYADVLTGEKRNQVKDYVYDVRYRVENREGHWLITEIAATGEERKEMPSWSTMFKKR